MADTNVDNELKNNIDEINTTKQETKTTIDIDALVNKAKQDARQDEKNKLYPEIEKLKEQLEEKTIKLNDAILLNHNNEETITSLGTQIEQLKKVGEQSVDKNVLDLQKKIEKLSKQLEEKDGEINKVKSEYEIRDYRTEKLKDVDESVVDLVTGTTKEEIDASVEKAKATYEKIASKFKDVKETKPPKASVANTVPPVNMNILNEDVFKTISGEDLWQLDPRSPEYKKLREQLGLK